MLRTCDCFGIQDVHIIENMNKYEVNPDVALGSSKWLNLIKYNEEENNMVLQQLINSKPDVLFLALGNPRQELWLNKYKEQIGSKLNVGVGAVFDFYTGYKRRSPKLFQKLDLEWAWRLLQEPRRLSKRYLIQGIPFYIKKSVQIILKNDSRP